MRQFQISVAAALAILAFSSAAQAGQEDLSFTQQAIGTVTSFQSLPDVDVTITDSQMDRVLDDYQLQIVVTFFNANVRGTETLTQLVLNSSAFVGMTNLPTVTVSQYGVTGPNFPTVTLSSTPSLSSAGVEATDTSTGSGDLMLNFLNDGSKGVLKAGPGNTDQAIFTLYFHGSPAPTAQSFGPLVSTTGTTINNGALTFTNVNGTPGALGAEVVAVPEPSAGMLGLAAMCFVGLFARRRRGG